VDVERARAILGVTAATPIEDVRRAYLRLVRRHNPEVDPEGFVEVRAAFELLRGQAERLNAPEVSAAHDGDAAARVGGAPRAFLAALAQLQEVPPMAVAQRASIVERAAEADPDDPRLLWLAVDELAPFPLVFARLVAILRRGADRAVPGALEHLSFYAPARVTAAETDRLVASAVLGERLLGARLLIEGGRGAAAADIVDQVLQPEGLGTRPLPGAALIDLALHCLQKGDLASARRIDDALEAHFTRFQNEVRVLTPDLAVLRQLFQEVLALAAVFPASAIISITRLLRGVGLDHPLEVGRTLLTLPGQPQDKAMVRFLAMRAPALSQALNMKVTIANYGRDVLRVPWWQVGIGFIGVFVLSALRMQCAGLGHHDSGYASAEVHSTVPDRSRETFTEILARERCEQQNNPRAAADCLKMRSIIARLSGGRCDRELLAFPLELGQDSTMRTFLQEASSQARANCVPAGAGLKGGGP
jgi:hypothetical protein